MSRCEPISMPQSTHVAKGTIRAWSLTHTHSIVPISRHLPNTSTVLQSPATNTTTNTSAHSQCQGHNRLLVTNQVLLRLHCQHRHTPLYNSSRIIQIPKHLLNVLPQNTKTSALWQPWQNRVDSEEALTQVTKLWNIAYHPTQSVVDME